MPPKTILIVDDMLTLRQPARVTLERAGYTVTEASNGQEALQELAQSRPDLILLDLLMPIMNGGEVLKHIRADATLDDVPVIVLTAVASKWQMSHYIELGATDYLLKPFTPATLLERVSLVLRKKELTA
jgi:two-component system sensor histidine kinase/response regulator